MCAHSHTVTVTDTPVRLPENDNEDKREEQGAHPVHCEAAKSMPNNEFQGERFLEIINSASLSTCREFTVHRQHKEKNGIEPISGRFEPEPLMIRVKDIAQTRGEAFTTFAKPTGNKRTGRKAEATDNIIAILTTWRADSSRPKAAGGNFASILLPGSYRRNRYLQSNSRLPKLPLHSNNSTPRDRILTPERIKAYMQMSLPDACTVKHRKIGKRAKTCDFAKNSKQSTGRERESFSFLSFLARHDLTNCAHKTRIDALI